MLAIDQNPDPPPSAQAPPVFADVYQQYFSFSWGALQSLGVPPGALEDAAQEVWVVVHRRLPGFEGRSQLKTWLFGIAVNVARNWRRADRSRPALEPLDDELLAVEPDAALVQEGREAWTLVDRFLSTLDAQRREIFVSSLLQELPAPEVAEIIGVDVATVYNRVRALRRSFRTWAIQQKYEL